MTLDDSGKTWIIQDAEPHVCIRLKHVFPKIPKESPGPFRLTRDPNLDTDLVWFMSRYPFKMSPEDRHILHCGQESFLDSQREIERIFFPDYKPKEVIGLKPGQVVRTYQGTAIDMAVRSRGLLLVDPCGSGKTYTGAGFCTDPERLPAAVVCQVHLQKQWLEKVESFTHLRVHLIEKTTMYSLPEADLYIFRYSQLAGWTNLFAQNFFKTVVYDEPQELRTGGVSAKGRSAKILSDHTQWRLGLTATPIYGYGAEIHNVMQCINDKILGTRDEFIREWCKGSTSSNGKYRLKDPKALGTFLRESNSFLRRTKQEIGSEMPKINRFIEMVPYDEAKVKSIEELAKALAIKATTGTFMERGQAARELDIMVRQSTGIAKAKYVADYVRILVESGEQVMLMGWHREVYNIWMRALKDLKPVMYTGSESVSQKAKALEDFKSGKARLIIMSLRSAPGIDGLQDVCSTIVFGELDWSQGIHMQCIERLDREGQTNFPVSAIFLVADAGSDPPLMELLGLKGAEAHQVVDPTEEVGEVNADHSHLRRIIDRYLSKRDRQAFTTAQNENIKDVSVLPSEQLSLEGITENAAA
jgi:superfamily II DNA or RNA helicase